MSTVIETSVFEGIHAAVHDATREILKLRNENEQLRKELSDFVEDYTVLRLDYEDLREMWALEKTKAGQSERLYKKEMGDHIAFRDIAEHVLGEDWGMLFCRAGGEGECPEPRVVNDPHGFCSHHATMRDDGEYVR